MDRFRCVIILMLVLISASQCFAQSASKKAIAVLDLETRGATTKAEASTLTDRLRSMLVRTNAFKVVDRGKMESILSEVGFQQSGCTSTECAVEVGRILNVEQMISGAIGKIGALYTIDIISIDVESSAILRSFSQDYKGQIEGLIGIMEDIAYQLSGIGKSGTTKTTDSGNLLITSDPAKSDVFLDNKHVGSTPLKMENIAVGEHRIKLKAKGYDDKEGKIVVQKEQVNKYNLTLTKRKSNKWLWIGSGTVAIAGGATAAVLLAQKDKKPDEVANEFPAPIGRP